MPVSQWVRNSAAFWREYLAGKPSDCWVYIENVADEEPGPLMELVNEIEDPRISVCLDVGHARANSPVPLCQWIEGLGPRIGHVHLHNNDGQRDSHWPLNRGVIDMAETLDSLARYAPNTTYTLECDPEESLAWLAEYRGRTDAR